MGKTVVIPKELEPEVERVCKRLFLTPRQLVIQALENEFKRLNGEKAPPLKKGDQAEFERQEKLRRSRSYASNSDSGGSGFSL